MFVQRSRLFAGLSFILFTAVAFAIFYASSLREAFLTQRILWFQPDDPVDAKNRHDLEPVSCIGPRGRPLSESPDDLLHPQFLDYEYPKPLGGSYEVLGLAQTWMTADDRYGPYGYADGNNVSDSRSPVNWNYVDWGQLQDNCFSRNSHRFRNTHGMQDRPKVSLPNFKHYFDQIKKWGSFRDSRQSSGRTAIILRTWDSYQYQKADMLAIRSLIVETALASGAEYSVFLLVHIKDRARDIYSNSENYETVLRNSVPRELQGIAVLFDESLMEKWYPKVGDHSIASQTFQPVQLFAQVYSEFDHYWEFEMDIRFTGNTLDYLKAISAFAKAEPRKQSVERGSFRYLPDVHGTYTDFLLAINASVQGKGIWGPVRIPEIKKPMGPPPLVTDAVDDKFEWGVGTDADFISTVPCKSLPLTSSWPYKDLMSGFSNGPMTTRLFCPQAVSRLSWNLLNAVHTAQIENGLRLGAEATMPSFALWHGFKLSHPPQPWFVDGQQDVHKMDLIMNGGPPQANYSGFAYGTSSYDSAVLDHFNFDFQQNWWFRSDLPDQLMDAWLGVAREFRYGEEIPDMLRWHEGRIYAPVVALHPVKTNKNDGRR